MKKIRLLSVLNAAALLVHVLIAYGTQARMLNPNTVGEVSEKYDSLFTPASVTFAVWGVIYICLSAFCIYHIIIALKKDATHEVNIDTEKTGSWFILNNLAAATWLIAWTNQFIVLSVVLIFFQLITLIVINLRLSIYDGTHDFLSKIFTQLPLSIYFGWLSIATIANTSSWLASLDWKTSISEVGWTVMIIILATILTLLVVVLRNNVFYGLVVIWAFYGIILKRSTEDLVGTEAIINTAWPGIGIITIVCVIQVFRNLTARQNASTQRSNQQLTEYKI
jgi:hypothetical protein